MRIVLGVAGTSGPGGKAVAAMCRNIKTLFNFEPPVTNDEIRAASLQYVRKVSGLNRPSQKNQALFERAVDDVAAATARLLQSLETTSTPKNREEEARKAKARSAARFPNAVSA